MDFDDFSKIMERTTIYYEKVVTREFLLTYYQQVKELEPELFLTLIQKHMVDPDQGQYFPKIGHLMAQAGTSDDIAAQAGNDFDANPRIDGIGSFDFRNETINQKAARRRNFIAKKKLAWKKASVYDRVTSLNILEHKPAKPALESVRKLKMMPMPTDKEYQ